MPRVQAQVTQRGRGFMRGVGVSTQRGVSGIFLNLTKISNKMLSTKRNDSLATTAMTLFLEAESMTC
jgi:hypothetical protein